MHTHMGGTWDIPNTDSGKARWLVKGNLEEMQNSNYHKCSTLSLWVYPYVYPHVLYVCICVYIYLSLYIYISPFILDTLPVHYFLSLWEFFSVKLKSQAPLLTTGVVPKIQRSYHQNPTLISGQELKPCFKLLHTKPT